MSDTPLNLSRTKKNHHIACMQFHPYALALPPDFSLHTTPDKTVSIREFRGLPTILASYPADWSHVCGDRLHDSTKYCLNS